MALYRSIRFVNHLRYYSTSSSSSGTQKTPKETTQEPNLRSKTPIDNLESQSEDSHQKSVFKPWPNNTNPNTGEVGGPSGPEPTRFGDWERKGRVTDF